MGSTINRFGGHAFACVSPAEAPKARGLVGEVVVALLNYFKRLCQGWGRKGSFDAKASFSKAPSPLRALPLTRWEMFGRVRR